MSDPGPTSKSTNMSQAEAVIQAFGGLSATARALGHHHASTVHGWLRSGRIPRWRTNEIIAAAQRLHVELPAEILLGGTPRNDVR